MSILDSRVLMVGDLYVQRFALPGTYSYYVVVPGLPQSEKFTVQVDPALPGGTPDAIVATVQIENFAPIVTVDGSNNMPTIKITATGSVMWQSEYAGLAGFSLKSSDIINSAAITKEGMYKHPFGEPGEFEWVDANRSGVKGVIRVRDLTNLSTSNKARADWLKSLESGEIIKIKNGSVDKPVLEINQGQSVFWFVEKAAAPGITIVDKRLIP